MLIYVMVKLAKGNCTRNHPYKLVLLHSLSLSGVWNNTLGAARETYFNKLRLIQKKVAYIACVMQMSSYAAQAPFLLAENLGQVRMQYAKFKVQYENLLHDRFSGNV